MKTPIGEGDYSRIDQATTLLKQLGGNSAHLTGLDANPLLAGPEGKPRASYYLADDVNLNEHGYLRLSVLLSM